MTHRYFSDVPITPPYATLTGPEATHFARVMRGTVGDEITIFDGNGAEYDAIVSEVSRQHVALAITATHQIDRELSRSLILGVSFPKGDRQKWLVEKSVELGVARLIPLQTERSVVQPKPSALDKFRRWVIEASKQCRRNRLMEIAEPRRWSEFLTIAPSSAHRFVAHPSGKNALTPLSGSSEEVFVAIGPEGGFADGEITEAQQSGWNIISLGPRILRVETAALSLAAVLSQAIEQ